MNPLESDMELTRKVLDLLIEKDVISDYSLEMEGDICVVGIKPEKKAEFLFVEHQARKVIYIDASKVIPGELEKIINSFKTGELK